MAGADKTDALLPIERIASQVYLIRGWKVLLDFDLAALYGVPTKALNQAVTRNRECFPEDFMFRLSSEEFTDLRSQIVTSSWGCTSRSRARRWSSSSDSRPKATSPPTSPRSTSRRRRVGRGGRKAGTS